MIRLVDINGNVAASYRYDPYGKATSALGSHANINPLRYRGYVFDVETGLYYLQSRYYDPETGRFINADAYAATGQGFIGNNMFAYCLNNPVCRKDISGTTSVEIFEDDGNPTDDDKDIAGGKMSDGGSGGTGSNGGTGGTGGNGGTGGTGVTRGTVPSNAGGTTRIGNGHGNPEHAYRINNKMDQLVESGEFQTVYGNRSLKTAGLVGNQRPDIIAVKPDGSAVVYEFASPSQFTGGPGYFTLQQKIDIMAAANPSAYFYPIIHW